MMLVLCGEQRDVTMRSQSAHARPGVVEVCFAPMGWLDVYLSALHMDRL
jgi:hypothetical protein